MIQPIVPGFWDTNTMAYAGTIPFRREFPATTRIFSFQAINFMILPTTRVESYDCMLSTVRFTRRSCG